MTSERGSSRTTTSTGANGGVDVSDLRDDDGYAPLRTYAAIGDGRTVALIAQDGGIDWLPLPGIDGIPAFSALVDAPLGGRLTLRPVEDFTTTREYVEGTNVLVTTFTTASGVVRVTDALTTGLAGRLPWSQLARRVDGVRGKVEMTAEFAPGTAFRCASPWVRETIHGHVLRLGGLTLAVRAGEDIEVDVHDNHIGVRLTLSKGSRHVLGLVATQDEPLFLAPPDDVDRAVDRTIDSWERWSSEVSCSGPWDEEVRRSILALKMLVHAPTGALVAAATTSLPECATAEKNWDYRFAWVRDTAYALKAMFRFGLREETHAAISWMLRRIREQGPEPQIFYTLDGEKPPPTETITDAPGWRGIGPVKNGNGAADQLQLGIFGDLFTIVRLYVDNGHVLDTPTGRALADIADQACDWWRRPDAGMWELPQTEHYTTSRLGAWEALTSAAHLAEAGQIPGDAERWRAEADRIRTWVEENCWDETRKTYTWYPGSQGLDASILLHAVSGFDRGERMSSTIDALRTELGAGPHLYRYSGMREEEGAFVACSFWMVSALHLVGRTDEARALMDELVATVPNDVGMMAEMIDPATGEFWGNLPQALSHLALVNAAMTLESEDGGAEGATD
ncbi:glycoside hydrolase family 15 protein [Mobilicoccus pelagius]|uniref:Putative glycosidase n=1 Tax=Mobilicoccus pelagius NBRC 104925 TaxID=1089455 RepID=H5URH6_9MICO|nr:putative glycosidase [Mobilicoccus pelagius NBRC 104925]